MTTPAPAPEPIAEQGTAIVATPGHFAAWAEKHLEPYLKDLRADIADARIKAEDAAAKAEKVLASHQAAVANAEATASLLVKIVDAADPAAAPLLNALVPEAQRVLAEAERLVGELAGPQM